jgi:phosphate transport system ATP-binding protein
LDETLEKVLTEVGHWSEVKDRLDDNAMNLSGRQQQRLCFARTIALEPKVLLLDEPCSALDPVSSEVAEELIKKFRGKYTVIMVTHNLSQAKRIAQSVVMCWSKDGCGYVVVHGNTSEIFNGPNKNITRKYVLGYIG